MYWCFVILEKLRATLQRCNVATLQRFEIVVVCVKCEREYVLLALDGESSVSPVWVQCKSSGLIVKEWRYSGGTVEEDLRTTQ